MILFLTYGEAYSGIYSSQVIDVVRFLESDVKVDIKLVSFISSRKYFKNRKIIRSEWPKAIVVPMIPKIRNWRLNRFLLKLIVILNSPTSIIARSVLATNLAMETSVKKIVYDGRGAIAAEWKEYKVIDDPKLLSQIETLEGNAVLNSDQRISVSDKLVEYWRNKYEYKGMEHAVIPCTLNKNFDKFQLDKTSIQEIRGSLGIKNNEIVFIYSGSLAGWQSFDLLYPFVKQILKQKDHKIVFYSDDDASIRKLEKEFSEQVIRKKIPPHEMPAYLSVGDYGLLIREQSITNRVASPVKFAEYLSCGLKILISENIGDYSAMVIKNGWGKLFSEDVQEFIKPSLDEKISLSLKAKREFSKINYLNEYSKIVDKLN